MNEFADSGEQDGDGPAPNLGVQFVRGVVRSYRTVIALVLLGAAVGIGVGVLQPNRYVSNAKLLLRTGAREQLTSESLIDVDEHQPAPTPAMTMVDELQMLSDVAIFERVARELGPAVLLQSAHPARDDGPLTSLPVRLFHSLQGWIFQGMAELGVDSSENELRLATRVLNEGANVSNERGSSVIHVSYSSSSPESARAIVQALSSAFIERHRDQFSIRSLLEKSRSQLEEARLARDEAAKACVEQVSQSEIVVLETQVPRLETELGAIEGELFAARLKRDEISQLRTSLSSRLQGLPAEAETARTDAKPKGAPKSVPPGAGIQEPLGPAAIEARVVDLDVEDEALRATVSHLESQLAAKKSRLGEFQKQLLTATTRRKDLIATRDAQERRHAHILARLSVLQALENIDANEGANLVVLQAPTLEPEKVGPKRVSLLLKGLLFGVIAAVAFVFLRQHFETRLCDPETFERARGVPVLGVVPHLPSLHRPEKRALIGRR